MFALMNRGAGRRNDSPSPSSLTERRTGRYLAAATALVASLAAAGPALADSGYAWVDELDLAFIEVASDGQNYTAVLGSSPAITGRMKLSLDAHKYGKVKSWAFWPSIQAGTLQKKQFPEFKYSKSYALGDRPKKVTRDLPFSIPLQAYKAYVEDACNQMASNLRSSLDYTDEDIFAVDRPISVAVRGEVTWEMSGISSDDPDPVQVTPGPANPMIKPVTIVCLKAPPPRVPVANDPVRTKPKVKSVGLEVLGKGSFSGACSLRLTANIESTEPNEALQFRFESDQGHKSDYKSINTGANGVAEQVYEYDLPSSTGMRSGQVRIKFKGLTTSSAWEDYEVQCGAPTNDLQTLLPPKAKVLTLAVEEETFYQGRFCPEVIRVIGRVDGRGKASGKVTLGANGAQILDKPFSFEDDETLLFTNKFQLSWAGKPPSQQNVGLSMVVHNALGDTVDAMQKMKTVECRKPEVTDAAGGASGELAGAQTPGPDSVNLSLTELGKKVQNGHVCPERVYMGGSVGPAANGFSGSAAFFAGGSLKHELDLDLDSNQGYSTSYMHQLDWSGAAFPQQPVIYAF